LCEIWLKLRVGTHRWDPIRSRAALCFSLRARAGRLRITRGTYGLLLTRIIDHGPEYTQKM